MKSKKNIFGLNITPEEASLILIPVPWEATVSPPSGTSMSPENILKSYHNLNLYHSKYPDAWKMGIAMSPIPHEWAMLSDQLQSIVTGYVNNLELNSKTKSTTNNSILKINQYCYELKEYIKNKALKYLEEDKMVALIGGDHSTSLGLIEALSTLHKDFGVLQFDAQADLIESYQGFEYSHSSVMHNVLKIPQVTKLVQVGLRDYSKKEAEIIDNSNGRIISFLDENLKEEKFNGITWNQTCHEIVNTLPEVVYITFDIDGLDSKLCPGTAFPVPGGLQFAEALYLIKTVVESGRKIIGFDICEVAISEHFGWDIYVANKLIYNLAIQMAASQKKI